MLFGRRSISPFFSIPLRAPASQAVRDTRHIDLPSLLPKLPPPPSLSLPRIPP